ncbi:heterokaryon incompatibility protein-domain-containing protein, partial [Ilyonectria destructans]
MEMFKYDPINLERPSFRLLRILKGKGLDIHGSIFHAGFDLHESVISYEALSYTWGSAEVVDSIKINGQRLGICRNLYVALQHIRLQDQDRIVWVDAICIDQGNTKERGHQVQQMGEIYKQAGGVIFWLGQATYETNIIMDSLRQLQEESYRHACKSWKRADQRWMDLWAAAQVILRSRHLNLRALQREGLETLLGRSWFKRVWILQEVANAQAALVCCGTKSVRARFLALAPLLIGIKPDPHCQAVLDIMPGPSRNDSWWSQSQELYTLLKNFGNSEAHDSRDMIYALLGMSSDAKGSDALRADYRKSVQELIRDVSHFLYFC